MHIGIDLGTTNSLIAVFRDGQPELIPNALGSVLTPSVVAHRAGRLITGQAAREVLISDPAQAAALFKRGMGTDRVWRLGGQDYNAPELSALILAALKADAEQHLGQPIHDVVISVPAYFNELQRKAVRAAGRIAGLNVTRLINEPTAAALAHGLQDREGEQRILVFDLGGGTFDVSVLDLFEGVMEVRASAGDAFLGGEDFSELLARYIAQQGAMDVHDPALRPGLLKLAEQAKLRLSTETQAHLSAELGGKPLDLTITRDRFDEVTAPLMARLAGPLDRALADSGFRVGQIDKVVLVGGATRMPAIRGFVARKLQQFPVVGLDPDQVVALGAAVQAALVANDAALDDVVMTDVAAFTLGVDTAEWLNEGYREGFFAPIIERNSIVPISREKTFSTVRLGQTSVAFNIYQGESPLVRNNLHLGQIKVPVPKNMQEHEACTVRFTYDVSGLLEVDVTAVTTGQKASLVIDKLAGEMSEADIQAALRKMGKLKSHPRDDAGVVHLRARIEAAYAMARGDARLWVRQLLVDLEVKVEAQDREALAKLMVEMHKALDQFEADHVR